jgi:hypothetical protein
MTKKHSRKVLAVFLVFCVASSFVATVMVVSAFYFAYANLALAPLSGNFYHVGASIAAYGDGEDYLLWSANTGYLNSWATLLTEMSQWHFNTIRLAFSFADCPVNPDTGGHTQSVLDFMKMDQVISLLYSKGYSVIFDLHNWHDMYQYCGSPAWHTNWQDIANHYKGDSRIIAFELFNEPYNSSDGNPLQAQMWYPGTITSRADLARQYATLTDEIRRVDPTRTVVWADPVDYLETNATDLLPSNAARSNVIFDWHGWMGDPTKDTHAASVAYARQKMSEVITWQQTYPSTKQWLGEFGAFNSVNDHQFALANQEALCETEINICAAHGWGFSFWLWGQNYSSTEVNSYVYSNILANSNYAT